MKIWKRAAATAASISLLCSTAAFLPVSAQESASVQEAYSWDTLKIGGGGFVSGIVTGQNVMYARTDVGGAYKYDYEADKWIQLFDFLTEADRGLLSVDAMAIDPTDDDTVYFLCGCAYFSGEKTVIFKTTDGGKTFKEINVSDEIKVMGNGDGRQCGEAIAVNPDNPKEIYCGGDVAFGKSALIKSTDGGETWAPVIGYDDLGLFSATTKWPTWTENIARSVTDDEYNHQNGVASIAITDGKVYVATSATGQANVHVANVEDDEFTVLHEDLPTDIYPSRINVDANGELLITYIAGLAFNGASGGAYRYIPKTGEIKDISPCANGFGEIYSDPKDPNKLVASTCGLWYSQMWEEWSEEHGPAWGDRFFKSLDGGETWISMTPGNTTSYGGPLEAAYLDDAGYDWIHYKAIHWVGAIVIDPTDPDRIFVTSGNGVFACDNVWDECPQFYFHPDGIEEVVALDFVSTENGLDLSAIGDYDGFVHEEADKIGLQYNPNMGSTCAIAVCPQNTDVRIRIAENNNDTAPGFYTLDGGQTWTKMANSPGGKAAVTQLDDGTYRFFNSGKDDGAVSYSDDFGQTWESCEGIPTTYGSKNTYLFVEPDKPNMVYAYATYYNSSWFYSKPAPDASDAQYKFCVSTDYGKTFTSTDICMYDQCDSAGRIAYLGSEGDLILAGGWNGMYHVQVDENGTVTTNEKLDNVFYCKTVGYGAPEKEGDVNALYMYGQPDESDPEGIYRSTDAGKTWVCINTDHLYGGTGNGNFLVGDMDEFGKVYMSTVGCGIVYGTMTGEITEPDSTDPSQPDETIVWGDADENGKVNILDVISINRAIMGRDILTEQGKKNADVNQDDIPDSTDALNILKYIVGLLKVTDFPVK